MNLREFQGSPNRVRQNAAGITLSHRGLLRLNMAAYKALGMPQAIKLYYDEDERVIGIKPEDIRRRNAFPLRERHDSTSRYAYTRPFCKHFKIKVEGTVRFDDPDLNSNGIMLLALDKTTPVGNGGAARSVATP